MLKLQAYIHSEFINIPEKISESFCEPIVFYLGHKEDTDNFLVSFALFSAQDKKISYIHTFSDENLQKKHKCSWKERLAVPAIHNPHSCVKVNDNEFIIFVEAASYIFYVNLEKEEVQVWNESDIFRGFPHKLWSFCATVYKTDENIMYWAVCLWGEDDKPWVEFYKSGLKFENVEKISRHEKSGYAPPHTIKYFNNKLYCSDLFYDGGYLIKKTGEIVDHVGLYKYVFKDLYKEYCDYVGEGFTEEKFRNAVSGYGKKYFLADDFKYYLLHVKGGDNFVPLVDTNPDYDFKNVTGSVSVMDLDTKKRKSYNTTVSSAAHFEFDQKNEYVYISSHNFAMLHKIYIMGTAAIDKFKITDEGLKKVATFQHELGFRFTTHQVFTFEGKEYIATFGQPNRLFIIDADTMKVDFMLDIGEDYITPNKHRLREFMAYGEIDESMVVKTLLPSDDGSMLFIISYKGIHFFDMKTRKIIHNIDYLPDVITPQGIPLKDFYKRTTHCQYFV